MHSDRWLWLGVTLVAFGCSDPVASDPPKTDAGKPDVVVIDDAAADAPVITPDAGDAGDGAVAPTWQCSPTTTWINPKAVGVSGTSVFGAITADETTVAWITNKTLHWADRKTTSDPWGSEATVSMQSLATTRLAISASGLRVIVVVASGKNLGEVTRASKADAFVGPPDSTLYQPIAFALSEAPVGSRVDDPVLAQDEAHLYFTLDFPNASSSIRESSLGDGGTTWALGTALAQPELAPQTGSLRRPTGISSDRLTLFYWDEVDNAEHAAFRTSDADDFSVFVGLGAKPGAQVDGTCTRIYYGVPAGFEYATRQ
jgi:hypothetical protein